MKCPMCGSEDCSGLACPAMSEQASSGAGQPTKCIVCGAELDASSLCPVCDPPSSPAALPQSCGCVVRGEAITPCARHLEFWQKVLPKKEGEGQSTPPAALPKEYKHWPHCNGSRYIPAGEPGNCCSCFNDYASRLVSPPAALEGRLRELSEKWRNEVSILEAQAEEESKVPGNIPAITRSFAAAHRVCADELDAALAQLSAPGTQEPPRDDDPHICPTCHNTCRITHTNATCLERAATPEEPSEAGPQITLQR